MAQSAIKKLSGHEHGEVLPSGEKVVADYDKNKKLVGWHKDVKKGK